MVVCDERAGKGVSDLDKAAANAQRIELTYTKELRDEFSHAIYMREMCRVVNNCNCDECPHAKRYLLRIIEILQQALG